MPKAETFNRHLVVNQAINIFHEKGYNATSMQDLVDATGLNRSSIYNTFESKINLFLECLNTYQQKYIDINQSLVKKASNALEIVHLLFETYLKDAISCKTNAKGCFIVNCKSEMANQEPTITSFLLSNQEGILQFLEDIVIKGQNQDIFNKDQSPKDYALYLYMAIQGFRSTCILINDKNELKSIINTIIKTLI